MSENREDDRGYCETYDCKYYENLKECQKQNCWYRYYSKEHIKNIQIKKQLQAKEQECEKLKTQILSLQTMEIEENKKLKQKITELNQEGQNFINTQYHLKNELKKHKKAVHKYKVVLQGRIDRLHLSRRELLRELNSIPKKIACTSGVLKVPLDKFNSAIQVINNEDRYKKAIDEIVQTIINFPIKEIQDIPQTQTECISHFLSVCELKLRKILDIIHKAKNGE